MNRWKHYKNIFTRNVQMDADTTNRQIYINTSTLTLPSLLAVTNSCIVSHLSETSSCGLPDSLFLFVFQAFAKSMIDLRVTPKGIGENNKNPK